MRTLMLILLLLLPFWIFGNEPCSMNFMLKEGIIMVEATVDEKKGIFILDTGAPCLVLNANRFRVKDSKTQLMGASASVPTKEKRVDRFE